MTALKAIRVGVGLIKNIDLLVITEHLGRVDAKLGHFRKGEKYIFFHNSFPYSANVKPRYAK